MGRSKRGKGRKARVGAKELLKNADPEKRKAFEAALKKRKGKPLSAQKSQTLSVDELIGKVEECLESFDYISAQSFCQQALKREPTNLVALEMLGNILAETGSIDDAVNIYCFTRAVELSPDKGYAKYMYLGQLSEGLDAIKNFEKGIQIMKKDRDTHQDQENQEEGATPENTHQATNAEISKAYSSIAEIYLTDACFEEDAEVQCKQCLNKALEEDPRNAEAHQLMASYWLSKEDKEKARNFIQQSLGIWMPHIEDTNEDRSEEPVPLSYPLRIETSKILMELQDLDTSESVLLQLLEEDDEVVQVWYMLGLIQVQRQSEDHKPYARFYLNRAKKLYRSTMCNDEQLLEHTKEVLKELGPGEGDQEDWLEKMQEGAETGTEVQDDDDEDWSGDEDEETMEH